MNEKLPRRMRTRQTVRRLAEILRYNRPDETEEENQEQEAITEFLRHNYQGLRGVRIYDLVD